MLQVASENGIFICRCPAKNIPTVIFAFTTDKEKFAIEKVLQQGFALNIYRILNRSGR